jgi:hypothetical protein
MSTLENNFENNRNLSEEELKRLLQTAEGPCVSIYMSAPELGREKRKHPIKLKNLLHSVEEKLLEGDTRPASVKNFLKPIQDLVTDNDFWRKQSPGIAVFLDSKWFRPLLLPYECGELVVASDRFHLKPILPLLTEDREFCVLALSQNQVKCFQCTPYDIEEIELPNVPTSLAEALKYDDAEKQLQFHTQTSGMTGNNQRAAMFHGHGIGVDDSKDNILRFFRAVEKGLQSQPILKQRPLILAGVEYLHSIYRAVNTYPYLLDTGITGNIEKTSPLQLLEKSREVVDSHFKKKRDDELSRYTDLSGTDLVSADIKEIVPAADEGRIDTLFVAAGSEQWGIFDAEMRSVALEERPKLGAYDLADYAAVHAYLKGGKVYVVDTQEVPEISKCAAILRY